MFFNYINKGINFFFLVQNQDGDQFKPLLFCREDMLNLTIYLFLLRERKYQRLKGQHNFICGAR